MPQTPQVDVLLPPETAHRVEDIGVEKVTGSFSKALILAILAGAFIALGGAFAITVVAGAESLPYGLNRLLFGLVFSLALVLVVLAGAELFTCNNLTVMAWASRKVRGRTLAFNWLIVYCGNFLGTAGTALLLFAGGQYTFGDGDVGRAALLLAEQKASLGAFQAFVLGILCNALLCLAIWLTYSGRSATDKVVAVVFPVAALMTMGFEQSIGNMYFFAQALMILHWDPPFAVSIGMPGADITWTAVVWHNLVPVTLGNIVGGSVLVGGVYWFIYRRPARRTMTPSGKAAPPI